MYYPKFFKRLVSSLVIGGQAINYIFRGKISKNDLFEQLMESGPGSLLIVLITGIAAGTVFNIQVASQLTSMGVSSEIGGLTSCWNGKRNGSSSNCYFNDWQSRYCICSSTRNDESY